MKRALALLFVCGVAHAGTTRVFSITNYKDFDAGEAQGVLLSSLGDALSGYGTSRTEVGEPVVFSSVTAPDGSVFLGTGDQAQVYFWHKGKLRKLAKLDGVLVTALANGPAGTVFAGVMPGGRVFALDKDGHARELAKLDAEHVWSLAWDESTRTLYAATGPAGKLFAIDGKRLERPSAQGLGAAKARLVVDTGEKHLLSLVRADDGALYAGSAEQAILFKITPGPEARLQAVHDFEGDEVRAIARRGSTLYVAVNAFQKTTTTTTTTTSSSGPLAPRGTKMVLPTAAKTTTTTTTLPGRDRKGKGAIYRVDGDGRVEQLHALADGYFTDLHVDADNNVWAASGSGGRLYLIRSDRTVYTAADLPERQVLTLAFDGPERLLGTGDAGALYRLSLEPPKDASYTTKVFDAQFPARWGNVKWSGAGALAVQTRSGNTSKPDKTWSSWQAPAKPERHADGGVGRVTSPEGRYLQVRVAFTGPKTSLRDLSVYYHPQNQRPRVTEISLGEEARKSTAARKPRSPVVKIKWKVENPDDDELVYRLSFREEGEANWKPLGGPEPITVAEYDWNTEPIPDGNYVVRVAVSDERANAREEALEHALVSSPFLVDNRKPELTDVKVAWPYASGRARDSFSAISELAYSVDGGEWQPFVPRDGIFDDPSEDFTVKLPSGLAAGAHSLAIRAVDAAHNVGAVQVTFRVK